MVISAGSNQSNKISPKGLASQAVSNHDHDVRSKGTRNPFHHLKVTSCAKEHPSHPSWPPGHEHLNVSVVHEIDVDSCRMASIVTSLDSNGVGVESEHDVINGVKVL